VTTTEILNEIRGELETELRARLRERLLRQPIEWLVDELMSRVAGTSIKNEGGLDEAGVRAFIERCRPLCRERLEAEGYLQNAPCQGSELIAAACRTPKGEQLLAEAKAMLDALLFGECDGADAAGRVRLARAQRELLTIAVARAKAEPLTRLLRAATAIDAHGTWRDPEAVSHDRRAPNTVIEVEYGECDSEIVGHGIAVALRLINDLEINEQVLYARMENIEESSLASSPLA
jgi:hypothetical protein